MENYKIATYEDDILPYVADASHGEVTESLEVASNVLFNWFCKNQLQGNVGKHETLSVNKNNSNYENSKC